MQISKVLKKADIILAIVLIVVGIASSLYLSFGSVTTGDVVVIYRDSEVFGTYALDEDQTVTVKGDGHTNKITIKDGKVAMSFSDCKNQDCVYMGETDSPAKRIVCLPNRVVVEVRGEEDDYDAISR